MATGMLGLAAAVAGVSMASPAMAHAPTTHPAGHLDGGGGHGHGGGCDRDRRSHHDSWNRGGDCGRSSWGHHDSWDTSWGHHDSWDTSWGGGGGDDCGDSFVRAHIGLDVVLG
jgi:hypothetical protein